jgi:hypothetical protein
LAGKLHKPSVEALSCREVGPRQDQKFAVLIAISQSLIGVTEVGV